MLGLHAIAFAPDGGTLSVGGDGGSVSRWDPLTGVEVSPRLELADPVTALAYSPDARRIAVGTDEGDVSLFDAEDGSLVAGPEGFGRRESDFNVVSGVAFSPKGTAMAIGAGTGELVLVDPGTLQRTDELKTGTNWLWSPEFSPDGRTLAAGIISRASGNDGEVLLWDAASGRLLDRLKGHTDEVFDVSFSSDGSRLASASADRTVRLWDVATGEQLGEPLLGHSADAQAVMFDPTGTDLVSGAADGSVIVWKAGSRLVGEGGGINVVTFTGDGDRLISAGPFSHAEPFPPDPASGGGGDIQIWDTSSWVPIGEPIHGEYDYGLAVGPDGTWFAGATFFGRVPRWPIEPGGAALETLRGPEDLPYPGGVLLSSTQSVRMEARSRRVGSAACSCGMRRRALSCTTGSWRTREVPPRWPSHRMDARSSRAGSGTGGCSGGTRPRGSRSVSRSRRGFNACSRRPSVRTGRCSRPVGSMEA